MTWEVGGYVGDQLLVIEWPFLAIMQLGSFESQAGKRNVLVTPPFCTI